MSLYIEAKQKSVAPDRVTCSLKRNCAGANCMRAHDCWRGGMTTSILIGRRARGRQKGLEGCACPMNAVTWWPSAGPGHVSDVRRNKEKMRCHYHCPIMPSQHPCNSDIGKFDRSCNFWRRPILLSIHTAKIHMCCGLHPW